jgi:hypothetical protein
MINIKPSLNPNDPCGSTKTEPGFQITRNIRLSYWLEQVRYHSLNGASEGQESLEQIARNRPSFEGASPEDLEILNKIKDVIESKQLDPTLSPNSKQLLNKLIEQVTTQQQPTRQPTARRRLNFDDVM